MKVYPVLKTCKDVRYKGPMRKFATNIRIQGPHGAILKEKYWDGISGQKTTVQWFPESIHLRRRHSFRASNFAYYLYRIPRGRPHSHDSIIPHCAWVGRPIEDDGVQALTDPPLSSS